MSRKKIVPKRWVVLAGLLMLPILRTSTGLTYLCHADINCDGKVDIKGREILKAESGRNNIPPRNIDIPREHIDMPQIGQEKKIDTGNDENLKKRITSPNTREKRITAPTTRKRRIPSPTTRKKRIDPRTKRFKDNRDGTVTDSKTGLMWTKNANLPGDTLTFNEALNYIEGMNEGKYPNFGYTNWRLPTIGELRSLIDYTKGTGKGRVQHLRYRFQNVQSLRLNDETSVTYINNSEYPRFFSFYCKLVGHNVKSCYGYVWPVRSLE